MPYDIKLPPTGTPSFAPPAPAEPAPVEAEQPYVPPQPTASEGTHPLAISPEEGTPGAPTERILNQLQKILRLKYGAVIMYMNYGDRVRAHYRDAIYDHFKEHLKQER